MIQIRSRLYAVALGTLGSLGLLVACGESEGKLPTDRESTPAPGEQTASSLDGRRVERRELRFGRSTIINWPEVPLLNDFSATKAVDQIIAFEFATLVPLSFRVDTFLSSFKCSSPDGTGVVTDVALYSSENGILKDRLGEVFTDLDFSLQKGVYAVAMVMPLGIDCERVQIGFEATLR